jgi:hypothetical protein
MISAERLTHQFEIIVVAVAMQKERPDNRWLKDNDYFDQILKESCEVFFEQYYRLIAGVIGKCR